MSESPFTSGVATASDTTTLIPTAPPTTTYASLVLDVAYLRDRVQQTQAQAIALHQTSLLGLLDERAALVGVQEGSDLLSVLASEGLSWATIARLLTVSDTAVRKWRRGENIAPDSRRRLARVVAFLEILRQSYPISELASWLEMRISEDSTVTPVDVYAAGRPDLLFEFVSRRIGPHRILDAFDPDWRTTRSVDTSFDVVTAPDGEIAVSQRRPAGRE